MQTIVIFGPVAAGKSTLAAALATAIPGACMLAEPTAQLQKFGLIEDLVANRPGSGLAVQMTALMTRLRDILRAVDTRFANASVIVCDGHICLDGKLYNPEHIYCGRMNITDVCVYEHALDVVKTLLPIVIRFPTLYVYMRTSANECVRRCKERNRQGERGLPQAYFTRMLANCDAAAEDIPGNVLRLTEEISTADAVAKIREHLSAV